MNDEKPRERRWVTVLVFILSGAMLFYFACIRPISIGDPIGPSTRYRHGQLSIVLTYGVMLLVFAVSLGQSWRLLAEWLRHRNV